MVVARSISAKALTITPEDSYSRAGDNGIAGRSLIKSNVNDSNPILHGRMGQAERAFSAASTFLSGIMAISASQFIGAPLKLVDVKFYDAYMAWTKESFAVLVTTITQFWSPTVVRVSGDESMKGQLYQMDDGSLKCNFPHRLVLMANHQLYTDWLYLWWIAYTNKMHGRIYIILKESLKQLPIFGWGAQFYNFIFLSRKWDTDKFRFKSALSHLNNSKEAMWLLIFPEGTNLSAVTREKSASWAEKTGVPDMKHQLLPRTTGLQFCLKELRQTTNWLYDCTIAYEGIPEGLYGQDVFTLRSSFLEGRPPKSVNMFWRRFKISDIPIDNDVAFGRWLGNRWREKDYMLEYFYKYNRFPAGEAMKALAAADGKRSPKHAKSIITEVKGGGWDEFLSIFGPITNAAGALSSVDLTEPINFDALLAKVASQQQLSFLGMGEGPLGAASQQVVQKALLAAQKSQAIPQPVLEFLIKEPPQTQEQMQRAITTSAKKSGNTKIAKQAKKAPAAKKAIPAQTQQNLAAAVKQTRRMTSQAAQPKVKTISNPPPSAQKAMTTGNMSSMAARPLRTTVVQSTVASKGNPNAKQKRTALSSQIGANKTTTKKTNEDNKVLRVNKALSVASAPVTTKKQPAQPNAMNSIRRQSVNPLSVTKQQSSVGSIPMGARKYADSMKA